MKRRGGKDVGIANRRGTRDTSPLARTRGVREVSASRDGDRIAEADGSLKFPEVLRPAPGEGISAGCRGETSMNLGGGLASLALFTTGCSASPWCEHFVFVFFVPGKPTSNCPPTRKTGLTRVMRTRFRMVSKFENGQHRTTPPEIGVNTSSGGLSRERC